MRMEAGIGLRNDVDVDVNGEGMKIDRNMEGVDGNRNGCRSKA